MYSIINTGRGETMPEISKANVRIMSRTLTLKDVWIVTAHKISSTIE